MWKAVNHKLKQCCVWRGTCAAFCQSESQMWQWLTYRLLLAMSVHAWTSPGSASSLSQPSSSPASLMSEMPDLDDFEDIASPVSPNWTPPTPPGANCAHPLEESGEGYKPDDSLSDDSASSTSHENAPGGEPALDASFTTVSAGTVTVLVSVR
jgi:hypothetical protein